MSPNNHSAPGTKTEAGRLRDAWDRYEEEDLDSYLVSSVENPLINAQSMLTRALIADTLWPGQFDELISAELRFGAVLTWLTLALEADWDRHDLLEQLEEDDAALPQFLRDTWKLHAEDDTSCHYIADSLLLAPPDNPRGLHTRSFGLFAEVWKSHLRCEQNKAPKPLSLMEAACGSANDFRYFESFGLLPFVDYRGFDISSKNITNARRKHPHTLFEERDAMNTRLPDDCADFYLAHDLFEHLSIAGLEAALNEALRVTRKQAWLHFFNLDKIPKHNVRPIDSYHWNCLSLEKVTTILESKGSRVESINIGSWLREKTDWEDYYNPEAWTLIVTM